MHEDDETGDGDDGAAQPLAPAAGHHGEPIAPGEARLVAGKPDGTARLSDHAASVASATSARNVSSRLALSPPPALPFVPALQRSSSRVPSAISLPRVMTPMRSAMRSATSRIWVVMMMVP